MELVGWSIRWVGAFAGLYEASVIPTNLCEAESIKAAYSKYMFRITIHPLHANKTILRQPSDLTCSDVNTLVRRRAREATFFLSLARGLGLHPGPAKTSSRFQERPECQSGSGLWPLAFVSNNQSFHQEPQDGITFARWHLTNLLLISVLLYNIVANKL